MTDLSAIQNPDDQALHRDGISYRMGANHWPLKRVLFGLYKWSILMAIAIAATECLKDVWQTNLIISENDANRARDMWKIDSARQARKWRGQ